MPAGQAGVGHLEEGRRYWTSGILQPFWLARVVLISSVRRIMFFCIDMFSVWWFGFLPRCLGPLFAGGSLVEAL